MSSYCKLKVKVEDSDTLEFYYAYNSRSTINDLIEFIAYYFPEKNICPCYKMKASYEMKESMDLEGNWHFFDCVTKYMNFELYNPNEDCICSFELKNNFRKSKLQIIEELTRNLKEPIKNSLIKMSEKSGLIIGNEKMILNKDANFTDFYDIIVDIKSVKDICQGWEIKMSKRAEEDYAKLKEEKVIRIGVIGNANKGKSFLLSKISKINLPSGTNIRTEGLSIKYPDLDKYKDRRIVLLDSAGLETPVLIGDENKKEENDLFKEKSREKLITEFFLQNYIINNSDILLIVVGILTYSEQKLLNKIKIQLKNSQFAKKNKNLFIVHNLMTITKMEQVNEYVENILKKSVTFELEEGHKISTSTEKEDGLYFVEKMEDKNNTLQIYHYIMANEGSEAGIYCNEFTIKQLNKFFVVAKDEQFDVVQTIKERFMDMAQEMFEKNEEISLDNFDKEDPKKIKLNKPNNLIMKKCLIDELGFSNLRTNGYMPVYNYYRKDDKLIIRIEAPGNCELKTSVVKSGEYNYIKMEGVKRKDKEPAELKDNIYSNRELGDFSLDIPLSSSDYNLKNEKPTITSGKGIFIVTYTIDENKIYEEFKPKEEEDI